MIKNEKSKVLQCTDIDTIDTNIQESLEEESLTLLQKILINLRDFGLAVIIVLILHQIVGFNAFVTSGSMQPTMATGDFFLTNKLPLYYRDPVRSEIIVFNTHEQNGDKAIYVKRAIGLPGDEVNIINGHVVINGEYLDESAYLDTSVVTEATGTTKFPLILGEDEFFVLGDNRTNSRDGRYLGPIHKDDIRGVAEFLIYPFNKMGVIE